MRRRGKGEGQGEQHNPRAPLTWGPLHGVGYAHGGIEGSEQSKRGENFIVGIGTGVNHRRRKAVQGQRDKAAGIAIETARNPPQRSPQENAGEQETAVLQQQNVTEFVAHLPGRGVRVLTGEHALQGQWQPGDTVPERAIGYVPAAGEVSGQRVGLLPHLTAAAGEVVVSRGERLAVKHPQALRQQQQQQQGCELLRAMELKA